MLRGLFGFLDQCCSAHHWHCTQVSLCDQSPSPLNRALLEWLLVARAVHQTCETPACPHTCAQAYEARRAARDAEREAQEAAQEAEIARAAEERRRREEEEAAKWMHLFSVEAAGEEALSKEEGEVGWGGGAGGRVACQQAGTWRALAGVPLPGHPALPQPLAGRLPTPCSPCAPAGPAPPLRRPRPLGLWSTSAAARRWRWRSWRRSLACARRWAPAALGSLGTPSTDQATEQLVR